MEKDGYISQAQIDAVTNALQKARDDPTYLSSISGGGPVRAFEQAFSDAVGARYTLALSSCTAALHTALMALNIGPGDEVIVSPFTWGQSIAPVLFVGADPVFADLDKKTSTICPKSVQNLISRKTKAIMPIHNFGNLADMHALCEIGQKHSIPIIADATNAFEALSRERKRESLGDVSCFSIGRGKALRGGEGGVLVTNNKDIYEKAVALTQHPVRVARDVFKEKYRIGEFGWNYRIHPLAAVLALEDL